jgi:hypothetical protein
VSIYVSIVWFLTTKTSVCHWHYKKTQSMISKNVSLKTVVDFSFLNHPIKESEYELKPRHLNLSGWGGAYAAERINIIK